MFHALMAAEPGCFDTGLQLGAESVAAARFPARAAPARTLAAPAPWQARRPYVPSESQCVQLLAQERERAQQADGLATASATPALEGALSVRPLDDDSAPVAQQDSAEPASVWLGFGLGPGCPANQR
jgi:hypothetical protein